MTTSSLPCLPLAQTLWERFSQGLSEEFSGRRLNLSDALMGVAVVLAIVTIVFGLSCFLRARDRYRAFHSPTRLFVALCRAHRLRWRECWWLWRLARFQQLAEPARLFLEAERFESEQLGPRLQKRGRELTQLRERLFADGGLKASQTKPAHGGRRQQSGKKEAFRAPAVPLSALSAPAAEPVAPNGPPAAARPPIAAPPTLDLPPWNSAANAPLPD